jgi:hypothetical protein
MGELALARRGIRLRSGFVVHDETDFPGAAGDQSAALFVLRGGGL